VATAEQKKATSKSAGRKSASRKSAGPKAKGAEKSAGATRSPGLRAADKNKLDAKDFAFPKERKEPLVDAKHVRNAVARFDQVEGVTDKERDQAWRRIKTAATKFGVELDEKSWRELSSGGKPKKR
jgi:hypothetical protein